MEKFLKSKSNLKSLTKTLLIFVLINYFNNNKKTDWYSLWKILYLFPKNIKKKSIKT